MNDSAKRNPAPGLRRLRDGSPALHAPLLALARAFAVVGHGHGRRPPPRRLAQRVEIDDPERSVADDHLRAHIDAAAPAQQKIGGATAEAIALQLPGLADRELETPLWVRCRHGVVQTAERALAGPDVPALAGHGGAVCEADRPAMATAFIGRLAHDFSFEPGCIKPRRRTA